MVGEGRLRRGRAFIGRCVCREGEVRGMGAGVSAGGGEEGVAERELIKKKIVQDAGMI